MQRERERRRGEEERASDALLVPRPRLEGKHGTGVRIPDRSSYSGAFTPTDGELWERERERGEQERNSK